MNGSIYSEAIEEARAAAASLGPRLAGVDVHGGVARAQCTVCAASVAVLLGAMPLRTLGLAIEMPCRHGEKNTPPPAKPAPPTQVKAPRVKAPAPSRPTPAPQPAPAWDDSPFAGLRETAIVR